MLNIFIQIILSIFLIAVMALISYSVYNKEILKGIKVSNSTRKITSIFNGIFNFDRSIIEQETQNMNDLSYLDINPSINQNGGAEYSYNFWLYFDVNIEDTIIAKSKYSTLALANPSNYQYAYINLFYKGDRVLNTDATQYHTHKYECNKLADSVKLDPVVLLKNPLVKIRNDAKEIIIEYNNINFPETYNSTSMPLNCDESSMATRNINKFGIKQIDVSNTKKLYNMITIVFQEVPPNENAINANKANCRVYFNSTLIEDRVANVSSIENINDNSSFKSRVMRTNNSKLRINDYRLNSSINDSSIKAEPESSGSGSVRKDAIKMADLTYFNYALNQMEINSLYKAGFNKYTAQLTEMPTDAFDTYTKGDKIDITTDERIVNPI
jgi:hypothetical protein